MVVEGQALVQAIADEDLDRKNNEKISVVHFVCFRLPPALCAAVKGGARVKLCCDHTNYPAQVLIPPEAFASLASDLHWPRGRPGPDRGFCGPRSAQLS